MRVKPSMHSRQARAPKPYNRPIQLDPSSDVPCDSLAASTSRTWTSWTPASTSKIFSQQSTSDTMPSSNAWDEEIAAFTADWPGPDASCSVSPSSPQIPTEYVPPSVDELDTLLRPLSISSPNEDGAPLKSSFAPSNSTAVTLPPCFVPATNSTMPLARKSAFPPYMSKPHPPTPVNGIALSAIASASPSTPSSTGDQPASTMLTLENVGKMPSLDRADSDVTLVDGTSNKGEMTKAALASKIVDALTGSSVDALPGAFVDSFTGAPDGSCDMDLDGGKAMNVDGEKPVDGQATQSAILGTFAATLALQIAAAGMARAMSD
ncbi:hypothetical protein EV122DRAFT_281700 [Schizophyllum commune]